MVLGAAEVKVINGIATILALSRFIGVFSALDMRQQTLGPADYTMKEAYVMKTSLDHFAFALCACLQGYDKGPTWH